MKLNKDQILSIIRFTLTTVGVSLVASGKIDEATITNISGILMASVSGIWSLLDKTDANFVKKMADYEDRIKDLEKYETTNKTTT